MATGAFVLFSYGLGSAIQCPFELIQWKSFDFRFILFSLLVFILIPTCRFGSFRPTSVCRLYGIEELEHCKYIMTHCVVNNMHGAQISPQMPYDETNSTMVALYSTIQLFKFISMRIFDLICSVFGQKFNKFDFGILFCFSGPTIPTCSGSQLPVFDNLILHIENIRIRRFCKYLCQCRIEHTILRHIRRSERHFIYLILSFFSMFAFTVLDLNFTIVLILVLLLWVSSLFFLSLSNIRYGNFQ